MFNINYDKLLLWLLPNFKRKPVTFAWLRSLCSCFVMIYNNLLRQRSIDLYNLAHDSRVFSIRAMLNDRFDNSARRISIVNGFAFDRVYLFRLDENKPIYLGPQYLHNPGDYGDTGLDFIVNVPAAVAITAQDIIEMTALVNYYKLAGKRFIIYRT